MANPRGRVALAIALAVLMVVSTIAATGAAATTTPSVDADGQPTGPVAEQAANDTDDGPTDRRTPVVHKDEDSSDAEPEANRTRDRRIDEPSDGGEHNRSATVSEELANASGTVEVIVQFEDADRRTLQRNDEVVETLKERSAASERALETVARRDPGVDVQRTFWITNAALVTVDTNESDVERLAAVDGVTEIHPNYEGEYLGASAPATGANDSVTGTPPSGSYTYGLEMIGAPTFWEQEGSRGGNATVVVIDTGIDESHPDLRVAENGWAEFDRRGNREHTEPNDPHGHGTHVSGTVVGAQLPNGANYGVAPNATLMVAGSGYELSVASAYASMEWALDHDRDVDVMTASLGFGRGVDPLQEPIRNAREAGVVFTGSAGNAEAGIATTPGDSYDGINVGAVRENGTVAEFSSSDEIYTNSYWEDPPEEWPDTYTVPTVTAPGVDVCSSFPDSSYNCKYDGTSMAAPHVAGAAALLRSANPDMSAEEIRLRLTETAEKPSNLTVQEDRRYGHGIVNVSKAATLEVGTVEGTVDTDGTAAPEAVVISEENTLSQVAADGSYRIPVTTGNTTVRADRFGYAAVEATVSVDANGTVVRDFNLTEREPAVEVLDGQSEHVTPEDTIEVTYRVAGATNVSVDAIQGFGDLANATLTVDGNDVDYGEPVPIDQSERNVTVTVDPDAGHFGTVGLAMSATVGDDSEVVTTGPTTINPDRMVVPGELPDGMTIPEAVSAVGPGTTIVVQDGNYTFETDDSNSFGAAMEIGKNVTVTAADGASPVVQLDDAADAYHGVRLEGEGAELSGLELRGDGVPYLVRVTGEDAVLRNLTVRNASVGVDVYGGSAEEIHGVTATDVEHGIDAQYGGSGGTITENEILDATERGIVVGGAVERIANNTVTAGSENAYLIEVTSPRGPVTIEDNDLAGGDTGIEVRSAATVTVRSNEIRESDRGIKAHDYGAGGTVAHRIVDNRVVNASQSGIRLIWANGSTIAGNEVVNPRFDGIEVREVDDLTVRDNVVRRPGMSGAWVADVTVRQGTGVTIEGNVLEDSFLGVWATNDTRIANTTFGSDSGVAVGGIHNFDGRILHPSRNVTVTGTNVTNVSDPVYVHSGVADVSVEHPDAVAKLNDDPGALENVTIADGTTLTANGTEVELRLADDPVAGPGDFERLSSSYTVERTSADARLDLQFDLAGAPTEHLFDGTLGLYTNDSGADDRIGDATLEGDRLVVTDVGADATVAAFGERTATIDGSVTADGTPHEDATVTIARSGTRLTETKTDAAGEFEMTVPASELVVAATERAHTTDSTTVTLAENETAAANFSIQRVEDYFGVNDLAATGEIDAGSTYTVGANVTNLGTQDGNETVEYVVDGEVVASETIELNASDRSAISFEHSIGSAGTYEHGIRTDNETRLATLTVASTDDGSGGDDDGSGGGGGGYAPPAPSDPSPDYSIASVDLGVTEATVGETVTVDAQIDNDGDADGEYTATLTADGQSVDSETVSVNSNWHETATLSTSFDEPGTYQLAVDGETAGTVTVTGQAELAVTDATVEETEVEPGETIAVTATVENDGAVAGSTEIALAVDGDTAETTELSVPAGETETVAFETTLEEPGTASLTVEGETAGTVVVEESDGNDDEGDSDGTPGFGTLAALLGVLLGALAATRRASN